MTRVLVVWEDRFHAKLDLCLEHAMRHLGLPSPELFRDTVLGYGGFERYVKESWPVAAHHGLLRVGNRSGGPIEHLICVADADRAHECCAVRNPATVTGPTRDWLDQANDLWTAKLRANASTMPARIHGRFLRWSQESLLIAAHDVADALAALGCRDPGRLAKHLAMCSPSPLSIADEDFADSFRKPERCLEDLLKATGARVPKKGTPPRGDAIDAALKHAVAKLCGRVPDLATLAHLAGSPPGE